MGQTNSQDQVKAPQKASNCHRPQQRIGPTFGAVRKNILTTARDDRPPTSEQLLQRRCQCGNHTIAGGVCNSCRDERDTNMSSKTTLGKMEDDRESPDKAEFSVSRKAQDFSRVPAHTVFPVQPLSAFQIPVGPSASKFAPNTGQRQRVNLAVRPHTYSRQNSFAAKKQDDDQTLQREEAQPAGDRCEEDVLEAARRQAQIQVFRVHIMLGHMSNDQRRQQALALAHRLICPDLTMERLQYVIWRMWQSLNSPSFVQCGPEIPQCGGWDAYTPVGRPEIHTCNSFFGLSERDQVRTMVHESAHAAGIGQLEGEAYHMYFDCETSYDDENVADSWSHFVHCVLGGAADELPID